MMNYAVEKRSVRTQMKRKLLTLPEEEKKSLSQEICISLKAELIRHSFQTIAVFAPTDDEPNIWPVIRWLLDQQKTVLLPALQANSPQMQFFAVEDRVELTVGKYHILQPLPLHIAVHPHTIDVMVVPGVAFDPQGNRLGRGKGYYDRYLSLIREDCVKIGVCFPVQLMKAVPKMMHDHPVNIVKCGDR